MYVIICIIAFIFACVCSLIRVGPPAVIMLAPRAAGYLTTSPGVSVRDLSSCCLGEPRSLQLLLLPFVASQRLKVSPNC